MSAFKTYMLIALVSFIYGCDTFSTGATALDLEKDFQSAVVEGIYSIKVPNYMSVSNDLSEEASLQYESLTKDAYLIVIDENKAEFIEIFNELDMLDSTKTALENYTKYQKESIASTMDVTSVSELREITINGNEALMIQIDGGVPEVNTDVTYLLAVIQGNANLYSVLYWTTKEQAKKMLPHFEQSIHTFQDL
ncbi:MAG: hypothetical protein ACJAU0_002139 [Flavobacteriales bacterium]|jgi:hypothetical protein